ncbi:hypothetical protein [Enterococcus hirae]|uniref:hypothetical protein n=1 Tax=Enterococcus hirae TaxID=1354 RepID=UPI0039A4FC79
MNDLKIEAPKVFCSTAEILKENFRKSFLKQQSPTTYSNTEASLYWIIRGCIDYFDRLNSRFLGEGNESGIPDINTDYFANNIYRLTNAISYLANLWNVKTEETDEIKILLDIRTLIVHSGEQITDLKSLNLKNFKDSQLGRIYPIDEFNIFPTFKEYDSMDYRIEVWNDKHDRKKQHNLSKVDHHIENESYIDVNIYLKADDVRDIILCHIADFLENSNQVVISKRKRILPDKKEIFINKESNILEFEKIASLVSRDLRGGYVIERGVDYWGGFGLKRLYEYSKCRLDVSDEVRMIIKKKIYEVMSTYWDNYQDENIKSDELPDLDIRSVFSEFTPTYKYKSYLEGEKLFHKIAPYFNTKNHNDATDIDYLAKFISEAEQALDKELNMKQDVDSLICEYFIQSIQSKIDNGMV